MKKSKEYRREQNKICHRSWRKIHYSHCIDCGERCDIRAQRCQACHYKVRGSQNKSWKSGRHKDNGYMWVLLEPDDFFCSMARKNHYILEHRLVMAKHLSRCLLAWEIVHHKNGIRDDNRIENLQLLPHRKYHIIDTLTKSLIKRLEGRVKKLETENAELRALIPNIKGE